MKKRRCSVKDELAYFYKVIKNMDKKDFIKQSKINEHETPLDEILCDKFCVETDLDKHLEEQNLLGWIELIDNPKLYEAMKRLPIEDQIFISYIVKECCIQKELAEIYESAQQNISKRFVKILNKIKKLL